MSFAPASGGGSAGPCPGPRFAAERARRGVLVFPSSHPNPRSKGRVVCQGLHRLLPGRLVVRLSCWQTVPRSRARLCLCASRFDDRSCAGSSVSAIVRLCAAAAPAVSIGRTAASYYFSCLCYGAGVATSCAEACAPTVSVVRNVENLVSAASAVMRHRGGPTAAELAKPLAIPMPLISSNSMLVNKIYRGNDCGRRRAQIVSPWRS